MSNFNWVKPDFTDQVVKTLAEGKKIYIFTEDVFDRVDVMIRVIDPGEHLNQPRYSQVLIGAPEIYRYGTEASYAGALERARGQLNTEKK